MHRESCVCGMDSLELFQVPATNVALEESKWVEYYPVSSTLQSDTPLLNLILKDREMNISISHKPIYNSVVNSPNPMVLI